MADVTITFSYEEIDAICGALETAYEAQEPADASPLAKARDKALTGWMDARL